MRIQTWTFLPYAFVISFAVLLYFGSAACLFRST